MNAALSLTEVQSNSAHGDAFIRSVLFARMSMQQLIANVTTSMMKIIVEQRATELKKLKVEGGRIMEIYRSSMQPFSGTLDAHINALKEDGK